MPPWCSLDATAPSAPADADGGGSAAAAQQRAESVFGKGPNPNHSISLAASVEEADPAEPSATSRMSSALSAPSGVGLVAEEAEAYDERHFDLGPLGGLPAGIPAADASTLDEQRYLW